MKKMLRLVLYLTILNIVVPSFTTFAATSSYDNINLYLDGKIISFDVSPKIVDGRTLVPLRGIFENMGAKVSWDDESKTAVIEKDDIEISVQPNSKSACMGEVCYLIDVAPIIVDGRILVPLRFIAESLQCEVNWDGNTRSVSISSKLTDVENITVVEIKGEQFESEVLNSEKPVFVDIYADWCGPCKKISPIIEEVAKEIGNKVRFVKIDGDVESDILNKLGISYQYFPTLRIYKDGKILADIEPSPNKEYLIEKINKALE